VLSCKISSKLVIRLQRYRRSLNISPVWHENGYLRFFRCFGVKNERKLKFSALSSRYECTDLKLKLQWLICIVAANFIKISETIADISHLTTFLNSSVHHRDLFFKLHFWTTVMLWIANMCHHAKFHQNWSNVCQDILEVWIFHQFGMKTVICAFFAVLGWRMKENWNFLRCHLGMNALTWNWSCSG